MKKSFLLLIGLILLLAGCNVGGGEVNSMAQGQLEEDQDIELSEGFSEEDRYFKVNASEFEAQMNGNYVLLDVRSQQEYDQGHINDATLVPLGELSGGIGEIQQYDKVLVYCRSGNRSGSASELLLDAGFNEVYDLQGGIGAWDAYKNE